MLTTKFNKFFSACAALVLLGVGVTPSANATISVYTSSFIAPSAVTNFNGFENIPNDGTLFTGGNGPYTEQGITVQQTNPSFIYGPNNIWVTWGSLSLWGEGIFSWYPNGGDYGMTQITKQDGSQFSDVQFIYGSGYGLTSDTVTIYELLLNGTIVASGNVVAGSSFPAYLGFSGGGFDEILMSDYSISSSNANDNLNAFAIDSIELSGGSVPEPATYTMLLAGLGLMSFTRRRKQYLVA